MEPVGFELLSDVRNPEIIASGGGVRIAGYLRKQYGGSRWRKMKGVALVRENTGAIYEAEIHWFEAHGVGRVEWKIKGRAR